MTKHLPQASGGKKGRKFLKITLQKSIPIEKARSETPPKTRKRKRETIPAPPPLRLTCRAGQVLSGLFFYFYVKSGERAESPDAEVGDRDSSLCKERVDLRAEATTCSHLLPC